MQTASPIADAYLRRVYIAGALRSMRSLIRALAAFTVTVGVISLGIAALGWMAA